MTKADLVEKIAAKANLTKAAAERALNAFLASVEESLAKDDKLTLLMLDDAIEAGSKLC